jgi:hypothetical protein
MPAPDSAGWRVFVRPDGYVPLTERLLPADARGRVAGILLFAAFPFVHLVAFWALAGATGFLNEGPNELFQRVPGRLLNAYLAIPTIIGTAVIARQIPRVRGLTGRPPGPDADWRTWLLPPAVFIVGFGVATLGGYSAEFGPEKVAGSPAMFLALSFIEIFIRIPQATAFWTVVVALTAIAAIDRLPGTFPEDRSLGLTPVGTLLTSIVVLLAAAFIPSFLFGTESPTDLVSIVLVFVLAMAALLFAVWRVHLLMGAERERIVAAARGRYAPVYRSTLEGKPDPKAPSMSTVDALVKGAESIQPWPLDEGMLRVLAIVLTGVTTGIIIRLILFALGF